MGAALHCFAEFRGDGRRQRANRVEQAMRNLDGMAGGHQHGHGFADARPSPSSTAASSPFFAAGNSTR